MLYHWGMPRGRRSWILGIAGTIIGLLLVVWLVLSVVSSTTFSGDLKGRKMAAETTLGNVKCRKTLQTTFPFFVLKCQDASENP